MYVFVIGCVSECVRFMYIPSYIQFVYTICKIMYNWDRLTSILVPVAFGIILTIGLIGNILVIAVVSCHIISVFNINFFVTAVVSY